jgi:hypothetical protein
MFDLDVELATPAPGALDEAPGAPTDAFHVGVFAADVGGIQRLEGADARVLPRHDTLVM